MKAKSSYFIMGLVGLGIIYGLYVIATDQKVVYPLTENEVVVTVTSQYPELGDYKTTDLPPSRVQNGQKIGETKTYGSVSIKPISVEEDSRCPANANCIWAGRVRLKILVNGNESIVSLGEEFPTENVVITLTEVLPQKTMSAIAPSDYRVTFTVTKKSTPVTTGKCYVGGCSGQICSDRQDAVSTCEYREEYACYQTAKCERQASGQCGWTENASLRACLDK